MCCQQPHVALGPGGERSFCWRPGMSFCGSRTRMGLKTSGRGTGTASGSERENKRVCASCLFHVHPSFILCSSQGLIPGLSWFYSMPILVYFTWESHLESLNPSGNPTWNLQIQPRIPPGAPKSIRKSHLKPPNPIWKSHLRGPQ